MKLGSMCFNWKVIAGLAAGVGIWVVAPNLALVALPLLVMAACPLSMFLMMRGMQGGQCAAQPRETSQPREAGQPVGAVLPRDEQLADLQGRLADLQRHHEVIADEIARLESADSAARRGAEAATRADGARIEGGP